MSKYSALVVGVLLQILLILGDYHTQQQHKEPSEEFKNFYRQPCTYNRQCDESYGYFCKDGICSCKFGRPDHMDGFKCKVQVKLGDFCGEILAKKLPPKALYTRRKCPVNSECGRESNICECAPFFERRGNICIPKLLEAGGRSCRTHLDCTVERAQQCYRGKCVECSVGTFKNYKAEGRPECSCMDKAPTTMQQTNATRFPQLYAHFRPLKHPIGAASCTPPVSIGDHCTIPENCASAWSPQLTCLQDDQYCHCPPGRREYTTIKSPLTTYCISPIKSPCSDDTDCHPTTAYCDQRPEIPVCRCKDGYVLEDGTSSTEFVCSSRYYEEVCGNFLPQNDAFRAQINAQKLSCIKGVYDCARPLDMFWDKERGKCISLVGGRCDLDPTGESCAGISRCWENLVGEFRCKCAFDLEDQIRRIGERNLTLNTLAYEVGEERRNCLRSRAIMLTAKAIEDISEWAVPAVTSAIAEPGDLIEFTRGSYSHWAVYIGEGAAIHVHLPKFSETHAKIKKESILNISQGEKKLCRINNLRKYAEGKQLQPLDSWQIVETAEKFVGLELEYKLLSNNCEYFATYCRFGEPVCQQVDAKSDLLTKVAVGAGLVAGVSYLISWFLQYSQRNATREYEEKNARKDNAIDVAKK